MKIRRLITVSRDRHRQAQQHTKRLQHRQAQLQATQRPCKRIRKASSSNRKNPRSCVTQIPLRKLIKQGFHTASLAPDIARKRLHSIF